MQKPTHEQIELRAYQLWKERGSPLGTPEADWFAAQGALVPPDDHLTQLAREVGSLVGSAVSFVKDAREAII
jgi:hypothetical protein